MIFFIPFSLIILKFIFVITNYCSYQVWCIKNNFFILTLFFIHFFYVILVCQTSMFWLPFKKNNVWIDRINKFVLVTFQWFTNLGKMMVDQIFLNNKNLLIKYCEYSLMLLFIFAFLSISKSTTLIYGNSPIVRIRKKITPDK